MTVEEKRVDIEKPEGHHCFACGTANPIGLNLTFYSLGEAVCSEITLGKNHEGWQNLAHGGIISTLLDEVMSWAIMYSKKTFVVTRKMDIKYVRNVSIGTPLTVTGKLVDDSKPPKVKAKSEIRDNEGRLLVRGSGEFVVLSEERLSTVPRSFKDEMFSLFERFD
ncbi:MAG: PaaI family thioesterase [Desulfobacteraceae bacterium]|nr:PaaI family thioesterase [Desulfobacteraceae bacterium]